MGGRGGRDPAVIRAKAEIRRAVWDRMEREGVAAFPLPPHGRIPNFRGAESACRRALAIPEIMDAAVVKVNPDSPQRPCREALLGMGKVLVVPTPRLRGGFLLLDPSAIPRGRASEAATIGGAARWGRSVDPRELPRIDAVIVGSVAVSPRTGARLGKSHGYAELEWGILAGLGKVVERTPVVTTVHDIQLVDGIPVEPFDLPVDYAATPTRLITVEARPPRPHGILWEYVDEALLGEVPILRALAR